MKPLTPQAIKSLGPHGRLEAHEAIASRAENDVKTRQEFVAYITTLQLARAAADAGMLSELRVYVERADAKLVALLWANDLAAEVGEKYMAASADGAERRRGQLGDDTLDRLTFMRKLIEKGQTVSAAARIAAANGKGRSPNANRKLWNEHHKKGVTHP